MSAPAPASPIAAMPAMTRIQTRRPEVSAMSPLISWVETPLPGPGPQTTPQQGHVWPSQDVAGTSVAAVQATLDN